MAIVINGSGTVTGISVGGLPDDIVDAGMMADNSIDSDAYVDASIDNAHLADNAVDTAEIADNAITLAKMASGTDGNIISYDASGNPVAIATGNDGQILTSAGAGAPPAFEDAAGGSSRYFHARSGSNLTMSDSTNTHITHMTSEVHQSHSSWSTDTFTAVADDAGHWMFIFQLALFNSGNDIENPMAKIYLNDAQVRSSYSHVYSSNMRHYTVHNTSVITIASGDTIKPYGYAEAPSTLYAFGGDSAGYGQCSIIGYKLN